MAKKLIKIKQARPMKPSIKEYNRCRICRRPHAYPRKRRVCRICSREFAYEEQIPSVTKVSW